MYDPCGRLSSGTPVWPFTPWHDTDPESRIPTGTPVLKSENVGLEAPDSRPDTTTVTTWPAANLPQQRTPPVVSKPQADQSMAVTLTNGVEGAVVSPVVVFPQHFTCPDDFKPQATWVPTDSCENVVLGGVHRTVDPPQQWTSPVAFKPQA